MRTNHKTALRGCARPDVQADRRHRSAVQRWGPRPAAAILGAALVLLGAGCGRSESTTSTAVPRNPKEAAKQVDQAFQDAAPEVQEPVRVASEAMRRGDYEKAAVSLQVVRAKGGLTFQQGMAVHQSMVAMEAKLISEMEAGDPNAKRAYELLKRMKRN